MVKLDLVKISSNEKFFEEEKKKKLVGGDSIAMTMMKYRSTLATSSLTTTSHARDQRESLLEPVAEDAVIIIPTQFQSAECAHHPHHHLNGTCCCCSTPADGGVDDPKPKEMTKEILILHPLLSVFQFDGHQPDGGLDAVAVIVQEKEEDEASPMNGIFYPYFKIIRSRRIIHIIHFATGRKISNDDDDDQ